MPEAPAPRVPDFLIVGAPKCGTTAMYEYLGQHPGIFMPFHKEPLYFGVDLTRRYGRMTWGEYLDLFRDARPDQLAGEASAWYLYSGSAAQEIHDASPGAQIIIMLRNPIDVMYAQHSQLLFNQQEEIADFAEALDAEADRRLGRRLPPGPIRPENLYYRAMARFSEQIARYIGVFGRDRLHIIVFDDLVADVTRVYRSTLAFLGADPEFQAAFRQSNPNKRVRSRLLQRLVYDPPAVRSLIPRLRRYPLVHWLRGRVLALNSEVVGRSPLDPALRRRLADEFAPEVERLGSLVGRDLSHWSTSAA